MVNNSNKTTIISHLDSLNTQKTTTYDLGNPDPGLGQAQQCGGVTPVNGIPTLLLLIKHTMSVFRSTWPK